jgi:hypothetical protein
MMATSPLAQSFREAADAWLCDGCSLVIRYIAASENGKSKIVDALLQFGPRPAAKAADFTVRAGDLIAGQLTFPSINAKEAHSRIAEAMDGSIKHGKHILVLDSERGPHYYSEMGIRDRWFFELHLQLSGKQLLAPNTEALLAEDHALRTNSIPFDGLSDLTQWLGLVDRRGSSQGSTITIRVGPPADILIQPTYLGNDSLHVELVAHAKLELQRIGLATRAAPGNGLSARMQLAPSIVWKRSKNGLRSGSADIKVGNAESILLVLTLGSYTIRRQWFEDSAKASNSKLVAVRAFDKELKQLRQSLVDPVDSRRFEQGVASLLFLRGFSASVQIETQAPDIVATTPGGSIVLIECTIKTSDVRVKVAKLVERRSALIAALQASKHATRVEAILVCALSKEQIASETTYLAEQRVLVLSRENIVEALLHVRFPGNPDKLLEQSALGQIQL